MVRSSQPQTSPPSVQPAAIWRSSIPSWSPVEPVPAATDRLEGSQPGVRGPVRDFPIKTKTVSLLNKGHFNFSGSFPTCRGFHRIIIIIRIEINHLSLLEMAFMDQ